MKKLNQLEMYSSGRSADSPSVLKKMQTVGMAIISANRFSKSSQNTTKPSSLRYNFSSKQSTVNKPHFFPISDRLLSTGPQGRITTGLLHSQSAASLHAKRGHLSTKELKVGAVHNQRDSSERKTKLRKVTRLPPLEIGSKEKPKAITKGTLTVLKHNANSVNPGLLMQFSNMAKSKLSDQAKLKLKWKTIQYLIENKKTQIDLLTKNIKTLVRELKSETLREQLFNSKRHSGMVKERKVQPKLFFEQQDQNEHFKPELQPQNDWSLNREEFEKLLFKIGLGAGTDKTMVDKLFWIFDDDGNGEIDHKELAIGLQLLSDIPFEEKITTVFNLAAQDGIITEHQMYGLLKLSLINYDDRGRLKKILSRLFILCKEKKSCYGGDLLNAFKQDRELKELLERNTQMLKEVDHWIDSDLEKPFHTRISFSMDNTNSKLKGIFFPQLERLVKAFEEKEACNFRHQQNKLKLKLELRRIRGKQEVCDDDSSDFSDI